MSKFPCPRCDKPTRCVDSRWSWQGSTGDQTVRRRVCESCDIHFFTRETLSSPLFDCAYPGKGNIKKRPLPPEGTENKSRKISLPS